MRGLYFLLLTTLLIFTYSLHAQVKIDKGEIIYHVFQRSFYDSDGDLHGDFNGIRQKLDYLQKLGVTSILTTPIYESVYYHNYFAINYNKVDPHFGTMEDFIALLKEIHRRGMKLYLDMETQYVTEDDVWWKDAYGNTKSKYSDYILWDDSSNLKPSSIVFGAHGLQGYNGVNKQITTTNLYSTGVQEYNYQLFKKFVDPNGDGKFDDGVDGFRLDHMMDDLDYKHRLVNLFEVFWKPLLAKLKQVNPALSIVAEQAEWNSFGFEYFNKGHVDRVFAFCLQKAIASFDKKQLEAAADTTLGMLPPGKQQIVFLENHDMKRFASAVNKDIDKEKVGAALNILLGGIPSIYYGQELGMFGAGGFGRFGSTDGNDIPMREAFEWNKSDSGKGMAIWYKNTGGWWDSTNLIPNDGVSVEEEANNPQSLLNFYRDIIRLRKSNEALYKGSYKTLGNNNHNVFSFYRYTAYKKVVVAVNLSSSVQEAVINISGKKQEVIFGNYKPTTSNGDLLSVTLKPYGIVVWELE